MWREKYSCLNRIESGLIVTGQPHTHTRALLYVSHITVRVACHRIECAGRVCRGGLYRVVFQYQCPLVS
eukprot:COSAG05_NODE_1674_length_4299_cov_4.620952_3_plen_69_part_00